MPILDFRICRRPAGRSKDFWRRFRLPGEKVHMVKDMIEKSSPPSLPAGSHAHY
ncbi:MAG: hypothetical protein AB1556_03555 [Bacillota bacterium]